MLYIICELKLKTVRREPAKREQQKARHPQKGGQELPPLLPTPFIRGTAENDQRKVFTLDGPQSTAQASHYFQSAPLYAHQLRVTSSPASIRDPATLLPYNYCDPNLLMSYSITFGAGLPHANLNRKFACYRH